MEFVEFPKMPRLSRECVITEKIDGTNAQIFIADDCETMLIGSRTRWITPENDNAGFARWCIAHKEELLRLGPGRHFGEWWGQGIQRNYGLKEKRLSLFNVSRWTLETLPPCVGLVPELYRGIFTTDAVDNCLQSLSDNGSVAAPGFMNPEGVVCFHTAGGFGFKKTIEKDEMPKTQVRTVSGEEEVEIRSILSSEKRDATDSSDTAKSMLHTLRMKHPQRVFKAETTISRDEAW